MSQTTDIIDPKTAGTLAGLFRERALRSPDAPAFQSYSAEKQRFETISWREAFRLAGRWQAAFAQEELQTGERVAIILRNCLEWILFDLAALGSGLVTVPLFFNDRPSNIHHILKETGARLLLVADSKQWRQADESGNGFPDLRRVVVMKQDSDPTEHRANVSALASWLPEYENEYKEKQMDPSALATIVYTSGTTGMPKGVMLSHANILENVFVCLRQVSIYREDLFLSFLPLSHMFERTVGHYIPMMAGASVAYVRSIDQLTEDLQEVQPTVLISVPRIYERAYTKIESKLQNASVLSRVLFRLTVHTGWRRFLYRQKRRSWNPLFLLWPLLEKAVAKKITRSFGGRLRLSISGGAPIGFSIARVFIGLGVNFQQGYGVTETSPVIAVNTAESNDPTTVGHPLPGIETRIAENGELLVRGPSVMLGYWKNKQATDSAIDADGYFHTGDVAEKDAAGRLKIVGRIKEIIVLSNGEKVPPGDLELAISENLLFEQVMIVGEGRPYLVALVVLNRQEWKKLAKEKALPADQEGILSEKRVERILLSEISRMIHRFPGYAQVRHVHASLDPWTLEDGLITSTLKLRRTQILGRFGSEVESLFEGH